MTTPDVPRGEIYDLNYRHYDGPRLGRGYAVRSLVALSLRNIFGFGRGALPKVLAFGLVVFAFLPAVAQVGVAALGLPEFEVARAEDFYGSIQIILVLFVAAMSADLVGHDRRHHVVPLYFSRPIRRDDYVLAKISALTIALLGLTLGPQLLMFVGNWLGAPDGSDWLSANASDLVGIVVSAVLISVQLAAIGVAIAMFTSRRALAMTSVLVFLLGSFIATAIVVDLAEPGPAGAVMLATPFFVSRAVTLVAFDAVPGLSTTSAEGDPALQIAYAGLPGWAWIAALVVQTALAMAVAVRHYRRVS